MESFRVLLVSESEPWCQSLMVAFEEVPDFRVMENVRSSGLIDAALRNQPDVVLWKLEDRNMLSLFAELKIKCPFTLSVVLVEDPHRFDLIELIDGGVRGCLPLRLLPRQIISAVELIVAAGIMCLPRLTPGAFDQRFLKNEVSNMHALTSREREVCSFLSKNCSNQEIATSLNISESTVKTHLRNVFKKIDVRNRTEALVVFQTTIQPQRHF